MDIRVLQYFLTVAREGSITRAAEILHMTQPPLSRSLMDLEQELGKQLLIRGSRMSSCRFYCAVFIPKRNLIAFVLYYRKERIMQRSCCYA